MSVRRREYEQLKADQERRLAEIRAQREEEKQNIAREEEEKRRKIEEERRAMEERERFVYSSHEYYTKILTYA